MIIKIKNIRIIKDKETYLNNLRYQPKHEMGLRMQAKYVTSYQTNTGTTEQQKT